MRQTRRRHDEGGLTITSLMDAMTIILCFLLKSYQADDVTIVASDDLQIPTSTALPTVRRAVAVLLSPTGLLLDGVPVAAIHELQRDDGTADMTVDPEAISGQLVAPLHDRLLSLREESERLGRHLDNDDPLDFEGRLLLQADRRVPFHVVRQVMYTAGQAGFHQIQFVVVAGG